MSDYIQLDFITTDEATADLLIAKLSMEGYEGFEQEGNTLKAFIPSTDFDPDVANAVAGELRVSFNQTHIKETNWNEVWESNFQPVQVDDFVALRAHFHAPVHDVEYEIVITPKMSFGTGHHATTFMMLQQMRCIDFRGKMVFDFGTGTGVLAILAEKLGAAEIVASDIDSWSIENAKENMERNNCTRIILLQSGNAQMNRRFHVILANINKNVILENLAVLANQLTEGGTLLLSGLLGEDEADIAAAAKGMHLHIQSRNLRSNWLCLSLSR